MNPAVSIVIPIRDQATRLALVLAALETQADDIAFEVIVVDDGSRDRLADTITQQQARGAYELTTLRSDSRGARGVPRNLGLHHARGEVVLFLDADALPGRSLVAGHAAAHAQRAGRLVVGDMYVLPEVEYLDDPARHEVLAIADVRRGIEDDVLLARAMKGVYPGQAAWHAQLEDAIAHGEPTLAAAGVIPHNLSIDRSAATRLDGFDRALTHLEGWELGVRAVRAGYAIDLARGARTFHLFHARSGVDMSANLAAARAVMRSRFLGLPVDVLGLWIGACVGDPTIPVELGLADWRTLAEVLEDPDARAECERLARLRMELLEPCDALDLRLRGSLGGPLRLERSEA